MADIIRIGELNADEINELLSTSGDRLCQDQASAIQDSVHAINRAKSICDVLQRLEQTREAA